MDASAPLAGYARERAELIATATAGHEAAVALARMTDEAVAGLTAAASSGLGSSFSILALGGYGGGRLFPRSDIDLLIVGDVSHSEFETLTSRLLYPLWDLGLDVGHQVRTPREHLRAVKDDLTILTASLTARCIAGDPDVAERLIREVGTWATRKRKRLTDELAARERPGSPYLLEPDLKSGAGGQRDLDELTWLGALHGSATGRASLLDSGLLSKSDLERLDAADRRISAARWALGASGADSQNQLTPDAAITPGVDAQEAQRAIADVHHTLLDVRCRLQGEPGPRTEWDAKTVLAVAGSGLAGLPELERAAWSGSLDDLLPGYSDLITLRRPALSHRWTVGAHSLRTATMALDGDDAFTEAVLSDLPDPGPLLVAALAHDVGKRGGADHAIKGTEYARDAANRFGLSAPLAWGVSTLVREHLLLSNAVNSQDLSDEDVILRAAALLGDRSLVSPLYLLARADMLSTGPDVWTPWRAALIREMTGKLDAALADDIDGAGIAAEANAVRDKALLRAASMGSERSVLRFVEEVPLRYLAGRDPEEVLRHARLAGELRGPLGHGGVVLDVAPGTVPETWRISVMTRDREGLFGMIAGVLSLADLDILAAEAFTETSGVVLDVFTVAGASRAPVDHDRFVRVERLMRAAAAGKLDVTARLIERRRHYPQRAGAGIVQVDSSRPLATVVEVSAPDRVGLLHDLAGAIHDAGLDIRWATVRTHDGVASDVFHLIDAESAPPKDERTLRDVATRLQAAAAPTC